MNRNLKRFAERRKNFLTLWREEVAPELRAVFSDTPNSWEYKHIFEEAALRYLIRIEEIDDTLAWIRQKIDGITATNGV